MAATMTGVSLTLFAYAAADVENDDKFVDILFIVFGWGHLKTSKHGRTFYKFLLWPPTARELNEAKRIADAI